MTNKKLLIVYKYPLGWEFDGKDANDCWKITPLELSKKNKVLVFSDVSVQSKFYNIFGLLRLVSSNLVAFRLPGNELINKIYMELLIKFFGFGRKLVVISSLPDMSLFSMFPLEDPLFVYDCTDYVCDRISKKRDALVKQDEQEFVRKCDLTFVNSVSLFDDKIKFSNNVKLLSAGFKTITSSGNVIKKMNGYNKTICYIGAISFRLDFSLLEYIIRENKDYKFVFIGQVLKLDIDWVKENDHIQNTKKRWEKLLKYKNVEYLGYLNRDEIGGLPIKFDIGIIPYDISQEFNKYCNPVKLYDYLSMGLPVVATEIVELRKYRTIGSVKVAKDKYNFNIKIRKTNFADAMKYSKISKKVVKENSPKSKNDKMLSEILKYANT